MFKFNFACLRQYFCIAKAEKTYAEKVTLKAEVVKELAQKT